MKHLLVLAAFIGTMELFLGTYPTTDDEVGCIDDCSEAVDGLQLRLDYMLHNPPEELDEGQDDESCPPPSDDEVCPDGPSSMG